MSDFLIRCKLPKEINRPLRSLYLHWKAAEFRSFLLYASIVVVKEFFPLQSFIDHFLNYYCSIVICSRHDQRPENYRVARHMILDFLKGVKFLYGQHLFTSNFHNLVHLVDDVERFGPLDTFSAYSFESKLFGEFARRITEIQQNLSTSKNNL